VPEDFTFVLKELFPCAELGPRLFMNVHSTLLVRVLFFILPVLLVADTVVMRDGSTQQGRIVAEKMNAIVLETAPGMQVEISRMDIKEVSRGPVRASAPVKPKSNPAPASLPVETPIPRPSPPMSVTNQLAGDAAKKSQLKKSLDDRLFYMEKEPLDVWPEPEPYVVVAKTDPPNPQWKVQRKDGSIEYLEKAPAPNADEKVWCVFRNAVQYINATTPGPWWGRMYWHATTRDWGASHPNALACQHDQDYAIGLMDELERGIDPTAGGKASTLWYELLNMRGGPHKDEADLQEKLQKTSEELKQLALRLGEVTGLGDLLWRIHKITIDVEKRISPSVSIEQRVALSRERRSLIKQVLPELAK